MLISLNDALNWHVSVEDDRFCLSDFLLDPDTHRPVYMILDLGGWFETDHALVAVSLMQHPDPDSGVLPIAIRADELRQAPHWREEKGGLSSLLTSLPPLVVGPFGATHAPLAMAVEGMGDTSQDDVDGDPAAQDALTRYERFTDWRDKPVFARDGEVGRLSDILHDIESGEISHFVVDSCHEESGQVLAIPAALLRHHAETEKGGHIVLNTGIDAIRTAPRVGENEKLSGGWQPALNRHFALAT